jgi:hypothetical protein
MRLGLALGKSQSEVRDLPYPEFRRWQLMYLLEPWGWENEEYRTAAIVASLHNSKISKKSEAKGPDYFMRKVERDLLTKLEKIDKEREAQEFAEANPELRAELIRKSMRELFGA